MNDLDIKVGDRVKVELWKGSHREVIDTVVLSCSPGGYVKSRSEVEVEWKSSSYGGRWWVSVAPFKFPGGTNEYGQVLRRICPTVEAIKAGQ